MDEKVAELWESIEQRKWAILQTLARMDDAHLSAPLRRGRWSPLEVVEHVVIVEEGYIDFIRSAESGAEPARRKMAPGPLVWFMRKGFPLPAPSMFNPAGKQTYAELLSRWEQVRDTLRPYMESGHGGQSFVVHPIFGAMDAMEVLDLLDSHLVYHGRQLGALPGGK
jgi:hypothetical protein